MKLCYLHCIYEFWFSGTFDSTVQHAPVCSRYTPNASVHSQALKHAHAHLHKPSFEFEFRIREKRRATSRRRFSVLMSRAPRVCGHFFVIVSGFARAPTVGVRADGWFRQRFADIKLDLFPCFVDAMSPAPSAQRAAGKRVHNPKQGLLHAAARAPCCQGQVQVKMPLVPGCRARLAQVGFHIPSQELAAEQ